MKTYINLLGSTVNLQILRKAKFELSHWIFDWKLNMTCPIENVTMNRFNENITMNGFNSKGKWGVCLRMFNPCRAELLLENIKHTRCNTRSSNKDGETKGQGPVPLPDKTSYHKISWSLEVTRLEV